jgi:hypothetical protein
MSRQCLAPIAASGGDAQRPNVAIFLPKNTSLSGLAAACGAAGIDPLCLERNVLNGQLKALTLYARAESLIVHPPAHQ